LNIFEMFLNKLRETLAADSIWRGGDSTPPNGVMWVEECVEFHRLWSGFTFVLCLQQAQMLSAEAGAIAGSQGHGTSKKEQHQAAEETGKAGDANLMGME